MLLIAGTLLARPLERICLWNTPTRFRIPSGRRCDRSGREIELER